MTIWICALSGPLTALASAASESPSAGTSNFLVLDLCSPALGLGDGLGPPPPPTFDRSAPFLSRFLAQSPRAFLATSSLTSVVLARSASHRSEVC